MAGMEFLPNWSQRGKGALGLYCMGHVRLHKKASRICPVLTFFCRRSVFSFFWFSIFLLPFIKWINLLIAAMLRQVRQFEGKVRGAGAVWRGELELALLKCMMQQIEHEDRGSFIAYISMSSVYFLTLFSSLRKGLASFLTYHLTRASRVCYNAIVS